MEEKTIEGSLEQIAGTLSRATCSPATGSGAPFPFEVYVTVMLDENARASISELSEALRDVANAIRGKK